MLGRCLGPLAFIALSGLSPAATPVAGAVAEHASVMGFERTSEQAALPLRFVFPQIGNGSGFRTSLVLYNIGAPAPVRIELFNSAGTPLTLSLSGLGTGSSFNLQLSKGEAFSAETSGQGGLQVGYALIFAPPGVDGTAVFTLAGAQAGSNLFEAGVPATTPTRSFSIYADSRGNRKTGLALVNPRASNGEATAHANLRLYSTGFQLLGQRTVDLGPGTHLPVFVDQLFDVAGGREGSLTVDADLPLAAVTLRQNLAQDPGPTLTAFPVIPARADDPAANQAPVERAFYIPQIGDGRVGDIVFQTTLILVNTGASANARVEFFNSDGSPLTLQLGSLGTGSAFTIPLGPGASFSAQTPGLATLRAGYARVISSARVGGSAVFTRSTPAGLILYEAGVAAATPLNAFSLVADDRGFRDTGLALVRPTATGGAPSQAASGALRLYNQDFQLLGEVPLRLDPGQHQAEFVSQSFGAVSGQLDSQLGSVTVESDVALAPLTLRQTDRPMVDFPDEIPTLTTFPVIKGRADAAANTDLSVLTIGPSTPASGGLPISYSIFVSNAGPDPARNVTVTDILPAGTQFVATAGSLWSCQFASGIVTCTLPQLGVQNAPTLLIDILAPSQPQTVTNRVTVASGTLDPDPANNTASASTNVVLAATDLAVTIVNDANTLTASAPASYLPSVTNGPINYTVAVTNNGPADASGVTLSSNYIVCTQQGVPASQCQDLAVPLLEVANVAILDGGSGRSCQRSLANVTCNLATVRSGTSARVVVTLDFDNTLLGRSILNSANVTASNTDPTPGNNSRTLLLDVIPNQPEVDLRVTTGTSANPATPGGTLTYTLSVLQAGPGVATNVRLQDTLPAQTGFIQARVLTSSARCTNSQRSCGRSGNVVTCNLGTMCPGNTESVQIVVGVAQSAGGTILNNQATVSSTVGEVEQTPANNTSNNSTPVSN